MGQNTLPRPKHVGLECDDLSASWVFFWDFFPFLEGFIGPVLFGSVSSFTSLCGINL
jgi:hypothetical protein